MSLIKQAGFSGQAANTMYGIVMAESGGNAQAHNTNASTGDNSYGLSQINMLGSMGPARLKQYGLSSNEDLFNPLTNLKVAYALSGGGKDFTPWTTFTSGAYKNAAPGAVIQNGESTMSGSTTGVAAPNAKQTPQQLQEALQAGAGPLYDLATAVPELKSLIANAVKKGMTPQEFQNTVENSHWYRTNSAATRQMVILHQSDPAEYANQQQKIKSQIADLQNTWGINLDARSMAKLVNSALYNGYDQTQLEQAVRHGGVVGAVGQMKGKAAEAYDQLQQLAGEWGQNMAPASLRNAANNIVKGSMDINAYEEHFKQQALSMYPGIGQQINQGLTLKQIADPYRQSMANLLELSPDSLTLNDPTIKRALQGTPNDQNKGITTQTPLWQFEQQVRKDPRWQYTGNAKQEIGSSLMTLGKQWGFE